MPSDHVNNQFYRPVSLLSGDSLSFGASLLSSDEGLSDSQYHLRESPRRVIDSDDTQATRANVSNRIGDDGGKVSSCSVLQSPTKGVQ